MSRMSAFAQDYSRRYSPDDYYGLGTYPDHDTVDDTQDEEMANWVRDKLLKKRRSKTRQM